MARPHDDFFDTAPPPPFTWPESLPVIEPEEWESLYPYREEEEADPAGWFHPPGSLVSWQDSVVIYVQFCSALQLLLGPEEPYKGTREQYSKAWRNMLKTLGYTEMTNR